MINKYLSYSYISMKTLIFNRSITFGFVTNLVILMIIALYLILFEPSLSFLQNESAVVEGIGSSLGVVNVIAFALMFFLFSNVAAMMQSIVEDRDSKVSEIINTSIAEKHYLFGKVVTSFVLILVLIASTALAIVLTSSIFSIFNPYEFSIYSDFVQPIFSGLTFSGFMFFIGCCAVCALMLLTSVLTTLGLSIKVSSLTESGPVSLLVLSPYFLLFGLLIFLPSTDIELWVSVSSVLMFIPLFSPIFILLYVMINGFTWLAFIAIGVSVLYILILFKGVLNVFSYAFYVREKMSLAFLLRLAFVKKSR
ncbi:hypothetical protein ABC345_21250 [Shouchella sp. 1P09AA]|uniref:hypothetical protein n=1 Tax=unclassified Shouchella TaxID=2893065 RepID=UPI0039A327DA